MKKRMKNRLLLGLSGAAVGLVNGALGAGGGMLAVPLLRRAGLSQNKAHANAVAVILPITVLSAALYLIKGYVKVGQSLAYIPTGLLGAFLGTLILKKISPVWLKRIFGGFMIYAGVRLLLK